MKTLGKSIMKTAKGKGGKITVTLTAENSRKLRELAALVKTNKAAFVNMMVREELDSYLDPTSGAIEVTIDGWKYKTAAEARSVAKALNAMNKAAGYSAERITCKGREVVCLDYRKAG